jgi:uncharacterized protein (TIGR02186 family)
VAALLALLAATGAADAETLVTSLSSHRVLINSNYTGTSIAVFGSIERDAQTISRAGGYEIVATVRGPRQSLVVREKEPIGPFWINQEQQKFPDVPAYLGVFSTRPLAEFTADTLRWRHKIGLDAIVHSDDFTYHRDGADQPFREALLRLKTREGLYVQNARGIAFLTPTVFRAEIPLPATAPPGNYDIEVALFADTVILARAQTGFELVKTGFEQQVGEVARDWAPIYGAFTALIAIFFGWLASVIFRRD